MSRLETAAVELHLAFYKQVGPTADWPVRLEGEKATRERALRALSELNDAVDEMAQRQSRYHNDGS